MKEIKLLKEGEAALALGINRLTLTKWRKLGMAPPHMQIGRRVYYVSSVLENFFTKGEHLENC